jgi:hypothetical protein
VDDVYFDGRKLPRSALATSNITLSALLDTVRPLPDPLIPFIMYSNAGKLTHPGPQRRSGRNCGATWRRLL